MPKVSKILYEDEITAEFNRRCTPIEKATPEQLEISRRLTALPQPHQCLAMGRAREYLEGALREEVYSL